MIWEQKYIFYLYCFTQINIIQAPKPGYNCSLNLFRVPLAVNETKMLQLQFGVCACVVRVMCAHASGFVRAITSTFMYGFQNSLAHLFSLRSRSGI